MFQIINKKSYCFLTLLNKSLAKDIKTIEINNSIKLLSKCITNSSEKTVNKSNNNNNNNNKNASNPYSSLYVSGRYAKQMFNVLQPYYDINYLNHLIIDLNQIKLNYSKRNLKTDFNFDEMIVHLKNLIELKTELEPFKLKKEKFKKKLDFFKKKNKLISEEMNSEFDSIITKTNDLSQKVWDLEEIVMPFVLDLVNDIRYDVNQDLNDEKNLLSTFKPNKRQKNLNLDYMRLSYINKCLYASIVGPHSSYLIGSGAQLQLSLIEYFSEHLRQNQFIDISGIDFVKSAIVEATHRLNDFRTDNCRIDRGFDSNEDNQHLHLVGNSSLESICALISKRTFKWTSDQIRLLSIGQQFEQNFKQNNCINASIITKENISDSEMNDLYEILWNCFIKLDIKCRSIKCCAQELNSNEYARYNIDVWLKSQNQWLTASKIAHYKDYIARRIGVEDSHFIESVINPYPIILSIIEQNQTNEGNFETPDCLKQFLI
jgi:seryl-tRNA synthetase